MDRLEELNQKKASIEKEIAELENIDAKCANCKNKTNACDIKSSCHRWETFDDWSRLGHKIIKGSKATKINGVNMFHISQVDPTRIYVNRDPIICYSPKYTSNREVLDWSDIPDEWSTIECPINM